MKEKYDNQLKPRLHEDWIDDHAMKIVRILKKEGFETYLVGGCIRDLLAGIHPKDYDIATSASPSQVRKKVPGSYIIGRRFKLVLVKKGDQQFEVATFRRNVRPEELTDENNQIEGDNYFGTAEEDAQRRDFTINALFFDPTEHQLIDYIEGMKDIESRQIKMIGDPVSRLIEDPIRIFRAVRLSHKLGFRIEENLRAAILQTQNEILKGVLPRRREEYLKILRLKDPNLAWLELFDLGILKHCLSGLHALFENAEKSEVFALYFSQAHSVGIDFQNPTELFSAFMYCFIRAYYPDDIDVSSILNDEKLNYFMREELGIFKNEIGQFERALQIIPSLFRYDSYLRKGQRRQASFISNDALPLALKLSMMDQYLPTQLIHFWLDQVERHTSATNERHSPTNHVEQEIE